LAGGRLIGSFNRTSTWTLMIVASIRKIFKTLAFSRFLRDNIGPSVCWCMSKKQKSKPQAEVLELLKSVLPKAVADQRLADKIYSACEKEISAKSRVEHSKNSARGRSCRT